MEHESFIQDGLQHAVGQSLGVLYADDELLGSQDPDCLQVALNFFIGLFWRIGLASNIAKSKTIICQPGAIWLVMSEEVFGQSSKG